MTPPHWSWWAVASMLGHLPWIITLAGCMTLVVTEPTPAAGGLFLLVYAVWIGFGVPAGFCGLIAWRQITRTDQPLRGRGLARVGMLLTAVVPILGMIENLRSGR